MSATPQNSSTSENHPARAGIRSTTVGLCVNALLVLVKLAAGIFGHTYALIADAVESGMDVLSSVLVLFGLKFAARPPDADHPQGHGKAEPLATLTVAGFLFAAAFEIARHSIEQIERPHRLPAPWTLLVLIAVVVAKELLAVYIDKVGKDSGSNAVRADARHQRSDVVTSAAAFIGISIALVGSHFSPDPRWASADDWAALLASLFIAWNGVGILRGALYELTDGRPDTKIEASVRRVAQDVPGVTGTHKCFVRKMGFDYYVELDVRVDGDMRVAEAHEITHAVESAIRAQIPDERFARVLVHVEPSLTETR